MKGGWAYLLEEHGDCRDNDPLKHRLGLEQLLDRHKLQLEDVPRRLLAQLREQLGDGALLKQRLCLDLEELELDQFVVLGQAAEVRQHLAGFLLTAVVDQPTRREGHEDHADEEDDGRGELQAGRDQPGRVSLGLEGGAADEVCAAALCQLQG